jgi:hypothetical protein
MVCKAKKLGSAFKKGYPKTYLKSQTKPIYRTTKFAQEKEVLRLQATSKIPYNMAYGIIRKKYNKKGVEFKV